MPIRRTAAVLAALLVAVAGAVSVTTSALAAAGCQITYRVASQWPGGFNGEVTVRNVGDPVTAWTLRWSFSGDQRITQAWSATVTQSGAQVTAANASYNGNLGTGASTTFGFNASMSGTTNSVPTEFTLNGVACTGATTSPTPNPTPTPSGPGNQLCNSGDSVTMGKYWINNNLWGQSSGTGRQCMWAGSTSGNTISWGTSWTWSNSPSQVKSYVSSVLGWHWGWKVPGSGLPVQVSANRNVNTTWNYALTLQGGTNTFNVAYDLWLHPNSTPNTENPSDEVMIWTYRGGGASPVGSRQATVTIAGTTWELWRGNVGWEVFSFVRTGNATSVQLNLRDFLSVLVSRGWLSSSKYLTSVQAGTEVFVGQGRLDTTAYSVTVS
ncbi:cellulose binding domain-containing protein [Sphaerisporangium sp. B11E5]|uniref:GH12 family glycosyl hydrolase domain-containing protein n=1 Tax=Sphaerisporangium sp. B11E5 TaxID=3153563 RepID=UPI00325EB2AA